MGLNIVQLREMVWRPLGQDSDNDPELPRTRIDIYLNRAYWEVQDKFPFREKERMATFNTIAGVARYNMPEPFESLKGLYIVDEHGQHHELDQIETDEYQENYHANEDQRGRPEAYQRINCYAELWPIPDVVYAMLIKRHIILTDLSDSNATPTIPQIWHEILGFGGAWRAFYDIGDFARMQQTKQLQHALLNTIEPVMAKEKPANTRDAGLEVIRNEYRV